MGELNAKERELLESASRKAKLTRNADVLVTWRDGHLVAVDITEHVDKALIKATH